MHMLTTINDLYNSKCYFILNACILLFPPVVSLCVCVCVHVCMCVCVDSVNAQVALYLPILSHEFIMVSIDLALPPLPV